MTHFVIVHCENDGYEMYLRGIYETQGEAAAAIRSRGRVCGRQTHEGHHFESWGGPSVPEAECLEARGHSADCCRVLPGVRHTTTVGAA